MPEAANDKIDLPCPVCGSAAYRVVFPDTLGEAYPKFDYDFSPEHNRTYRIVDCSSCTHRYASPRPRDLWRHYRDTEDVAYHSNEEQMLATFRAVVATLREHVPPGRLLDVGCATGNFLQVAREHYTVEGLELSGWAAAVARSHGLTIHQSPLSELPPGQAYDAITLWGVIEHLEHPGAELATIASLLKPEGFVCLWTGDAHALPSRLLGSKWWYVQGQHIQMFTKKSLLRLFHDQGFELVHSGLYPYVLTLSSINKSLARYPLLHRLTRPVLCSRPLADIKLTLRVPGEMLAIFRKKR